MATVTGYTAARMKEIEDSTVVGGEVVGDDLILETRDGTPINAGAVVGPPGPTGPAGGVSDHGALTGLADDDHPQYHNDARGDARYSRIASGIYSGDGNTGSRTIILPFTPLFVVIDDSLAANMTLLVGPPSTVPGEYPGGIFLAPTNLVKDANRKIGLVTNGFVVTNDNAADYTNTNAVGRSYRYRAFG